LLYNGRSLKTGTLEDRDAHKIVTSQYRYDHLKFVLRPDREIKEELKERCFPEDYKNGVFYFPIVDRTARDIAACWVDVTQGTFRCLSGRAFWGIKGSAYIDKVRLNGMEIYTDKVNEGFVSGQPLILTTSIWKSEGPDQCLVTEKYNVNNQLEKQKISPVNMDGLVEYTVPIGELKIGTGERVQSIDGIALDYLQLANTQRVEFLVDFKDGDNDGKFNISAVSKDEGTIDNKNWKQYLKEGGLILEKNGVKLNITGIGLVSSTTEEDRTIQSTTGTIVVQSEGGAEENIIKLRLVHLKDSNQTYSDENECNLNEPVKYNQDPQERSYKIRITPSTKTPESDNPPEIVSFKVEGKEHREDPIKVEDGVINITASFTDDKGLKEAKLFIKEGDRDYKIAKETTLSGKQQNWITAYDEIGKEKNYIIKLVVTDNNNQPDEEEQQISTP